MSVFIENDDINKILNYQEPSVLSVKEICYNPDVLNILSSLDTTHANYNKIPDALYPDNIISLKQLKRHSARNLHNCNYKKTIAGKGRYYKDNTLKKGDFGHLQNCYSKVRRLIIDGKLIAIDMCNAHIEIIKNLCGFLGINENRYEILNFYCRDRNSILNDIMIAFDCDRDIAKRYFLIILYGGSYDCWITNNNLLNKIDKKTEFMMKFELAFDVIKQELNKLIVMNGFKAIEKQINNKKNYKIDKSALAVFLQEIESKIMIVMYQYLESKGCIIRIPIHDGIWFDDCKNITNNGTSIDFLKELSDEIFNKLGLVIPLDYEDTAPSADDIKWFDNHKKFYENYCNTKDNDKIIIDSNNDDVGASVAIINKHKDEIIRCGKVILVKFDNCWIYENDDVNRILSNWITNANIHYYGGQDRLFNYSRAISHQNKCIQAIRNSDLIKVDNDFLSTMNIKNKTYIPFLNGIWSFKDKKLYSYQELSHIPFSFIIHRNFPNFNQEHHDELMNRFINPIFPIIDERNIIFNRVARSLAGHIEDKKWFSLGGARNSGKSKFIKLLLNSFGQFVSTFNANCFIYNKNSPIAEPAKALMWVLSIWNSRISFASEIEGDSKTVINGNLIKRLVSGGDVIKARGNYMNEISIIPCFTIWFIYNEWYNVEPANTCENLVKFKCPSKFVEKDELIDNCSILKLKDETIDAFIHSDDCINAFILFILNYYDDEIPLPTSLINFNEKDNTLSIEAFIIKNFIHTGNSKDCIHMSFIKNILCKNKFNLSANNIREKFKTLEYGFYDSKHIIVDNKQSCGFKCLKYIGEDINEINDDIDD